MHKCLAISAALMLRVLKEGERTVKVNIYIETDNGSKKKMYRGYGAVVEFIKKNGEPETRETYGACYGTWNLAYISALTDALGILTKHCEVDIYAANKYVCENLCSGRTDEWQESGWNTKKGDPVANAEEWKELIRVAKHHNLNFMYTNKSSYSSYLLNEIRKTKQNGEHWQQMTLD